MTLWFGVIQKSLSSLRAVCSDLINSLPPEPG
jgi:hypothetical protein